MEYIKVYIVVQFIFFLLQFIKYFKLEKYQYTELIFGSFFIIVFFGFFGAILTLDKTMINKSILFAIFYSIWIYLTRKISNLINSDSNGVIYY